MNEEAKDHVRYLRQNSTDAERLLWGSLRAKRLNGYKFRRQHLISPYIVDFICCERKLIVEVDGGQHDEKQQYDERRTAFLAEKGYTVIRFWNDAIFQEIDNVLGSILVALKKE